MAYIDKLLEVMAKLRNPETGCDWDQRQNFASVAPYTLEEAYEVADAIAREDYHSLKDELGDLLFQVVFHAQMASEAQLFDFDDVAHAISQKMIRRHPHVFGSDEQIAAGMQPDAWEQIKDDERSETEDSSAMAGVALALPALKRAEKLGNRASRVGFDWPERHGARDKIEEELAELEEAVGGREEDEIEEEFGDLLFAVVNLARHLHVDPEKALSAANNKFERRFREMERDLTAQDKRLQDLDLSVLEQAWRGAKRRLAK